MTVAVVLFGCNGGNDGYDSSGSGIGASPPMLTGTLQAFGGTGVSPGSSASSGNGMIFAVPLPT